MVTTVNEHLFEPMSSVCKRCKRTYEEIQDRLWHCGQIRCHECTLLRPCMGTPPRCEECLENIGTALVKISLNRHQALRDSLKKTWEQIYADYPDEWKKLFLQTPVMDRIRGASFSKIWIDELGDQDFNKETHDDQENPQSPAKENRSQDKDLSSKSDKY